MAKSKTSESKRWWGLAYKTAAILAAIGIGFIARWAGVEPKIVIKTVEVQSETDYTPTMGWHRDDDQISANLDPERTVQFVQTPAGRAVMADDEDVLLYRAVRKAAGLPPDEYPNVNQGSVGSCVGAGNKHCVDALQAVQIGNGARFDWKPVSLEVIYAGSRVEIGGGRIRGDGSVGAWAAKWLKDYGVVPMEQVGEYDLTSYSASRARSWGRTGVPDDLEPAARQHPVKGTALVKSWQDVDRAIRQGYPVSVCSNQGFTMDRDREGFCSRQGTWNHCMAIIGVKGGRRPGGFVLNSWGDKAHTGPRYPDDAPPAGFWADADVIDRMVRQGDSFALSDAVGFPSRKLPDWFVERRPARNRPLDLFAHVPGALAW